ncbi:MAG: phosphatidylglycerol lysyltransferase domain-containing protein [Deltaproteobacteria bacterium]|nr:phosphatidylglycerol lysyltransferase domain-containing protein [Deltaproteobacteria bacterium]
MHFEPLTLDALPTLRPYFEKQPYSLSVYSLTSIMAWREADGFEVSFAVLDGALFFSGERGDRPGDRHLLMPLTPGRPLPPAGLAAASARLGHRSIWYAPEDYVDAFGADGVGRHFGIAERADESEYVFLASDLAELKGSRYAPKRNLIHQFEAEYVATGRASVESIEPESVPDCLAFLEKWCRERDCEGTDHDALRCERDATEKALAELHAIGERGVAVCVDGAVAGFGIGARVNDEMGALHFEKAFSRLKGLYQYLDRECARRLFAGRFKYVNKEGDMGLPGLAKAKKSYFPVRRIRSFSLVLKG